RWPRRTGARFGAARARRPQSCGVRSRHARREVTHPEISSQERIVGRLVHAGSPNPMALHKHKSSEDISPRCSVSYLINESVRIKWIKRRSASATDNAYWEWIRQFTGPQVVCKIGRA